MKTNNMKTNKQAGKPRNPFALAARVRKAGAHQPENPLRDARRRFKQHAVSMLVRGDRGDGRDD